MRVCVCELRYGPNLFPEPPFAGFWALFFESFQDPILLILVAAAVVSFVVGLINHPEDGWIDGVAIVIAILLVGCLGAQPISVVLCFCCPPPPFPLPFLPDPDPSFHPLRTHLPLCTSSWICLG